MSTQGVKPSARVTPLIDSFPYINLKDSNDADDNDDDDNDNDDNDDGSNDDDIFDCDEEPHMLTHHSGYGYYPMTLGDQLHKGKYEVVRKLGWAGYSSVWLAKNCDGSAPSKFVAIKILTVSASVDVMTNTLAEADCWKAVTLSNPDHPGYKHCLHLRDMFPASSKHGPHICFVTDVLGTDLIALRRSQPDGVFTVLVVKRIVKQMLLALDYLHRNCRLIHTDIKPDNIMVSLNHADAIERHLQLSPAEIYEPRIELDLSPDPIITVKTQCLPNFGLNPDLSNLNVRLIDFGHANPINNHVQDEVQPHLLRAPEVILGHAWSTPIDIWSVGCLIFEYLIGAAFFDLSSPESLDPDDVHLERVIEHIGPFPEHFLAACSRRNRYFDVDGALLRVKKLTPRSIDNCLRAYCRLNEADITPTSAFMRRCLTIDPGSRPTALELLEDEWLKVDSCPVTAD